MMFQEMKNHRMKSDGFNGYDGSTPTPEQELAERENRQKIIEELVLQRYFAEDNNYLYVTEKDYFERFKVYSDKYPLFALRMKLWYIYM
jgi:hypothetical protein